MQTIRSFGTCAGAILVLLSAACSAAPTTDEKAEQSNDALRALRPEEIVGTLKFGETSAPISIPSASATSYRALRVQGTAGDKVDAWVRSANGDAVAWLLDASYQNVAYNDDASDGTRDAHVEATLARTGTYYVVFRDYDGGAATFRVSLAAGGAVAPETPATIEELIAKFPPGTTEVSLGSATVTAQSRSCNETTGCKPWGSASSVPLSLTRPAPGSWAYTGALPTPSRAALGLSLKDGVPIAHLALKLPMTGTVFLYSSATTRTFDHAILSYRDIYGGGSYVVNAVPWVGDNTYPAGSSASPSEKRDLWGGTLSNHAFRTQASGRAYTTNGNYVEYQVTISAQF